MNMNGSQAPNFQESFGGEDVSHTSPPGPRLCVTVVATTAAGTTAALNVARGLAKDLDAKIALLKMEVVPVRFPLDKPPVSLDFTVKQQCSLVLRSSAREGDVTIRTCLCRDRDSGLQRVLRRRAVIVIGGRRRWWLSSEERLEKALLRLGHHVVFIDLAHSAERTSHNVFARFARRDADHVQAQAGNAESFFERAALR
jgi:hypothetical protein